MYTTDKIVLLHSLGKPPSLSRNTNAKKVFSKVVNISSNLNSAIGLMNCLESKAR